MDTELNGYNIPRETLVFPNLYSASMDPKYWTNPEQFNPDRFLDQTGKLLKAEALIQFSTGNFNPFPHTTLSAADDFENIWNSFGKSLKVKKLLKKKNENVVPKG